MQKIRYILVPSIIFLLIKSAIAQTYYQYQPVTLDFEIANTRETASQNPFLNYRLEVTFSNDDNIYTVPGFYAADGDAANSGADEGGIWRIIFTPPLAGQWDYQVSFKQGDNIAIDDDEYAGIPVTEHHGKTGSININIAEKNGSFKSKGSIIYNNSRYLHTENGEPLMLYGSNSPENFLAYQDFDGTYAIDADRNYIKSYDAHEKDWKVGDPSWKDSKGKGIIGALNYLAAKNMNAIYLLTLNIEGDARDVWPFISHYRKDYKRYDVSKLAQWDVVFEHAENLGIAIELIMQEQENQLLLDDGFLMAERKLYLRELIARFSYHNNIIWNIGEENGYAGSWPHGQNDQQRFAMIRYIKENDPHRHPVLLHTYPFDEEREVIASKLLKFKNFNGLSMQVGNPDHVFHDIKKWIEISKVQPWIILMDEIGPWYTGTKPDSLDPKHERERKQVLWPSLMAGAGGIQWYFGWLTPPHDLNAENLRSRNNIWEQTSHAREFFEIIDYVDMHNTNELIPRGDNYCFSKPGHQYVIYLPYGGSTVLDLSNLEGKFNVDWYNPRAGGELLSGSVKSVSGGKKTGIGFAPKDTFEDWVVLISKE